MIAQSPGTVEYTDCIYAVSLNDCLGYDLKQPDGEAPVSEALGNMEYLFIALTPRSTLPGVVAPECPIYDSNRTIWQLKICAKKRHTLNC